MAKVEAYKTQLGQIFHWIKKIGQKHGAKENFFRPERSAEALPPPKFRYVSPIGNNRYGLRLYCVRLTSSVVILLNGDLKTQDKVDDCPNCKKHFDLANKISRVIDQAIVEKEIIINEKQIFFGEDFELNI